MIAPKKKKNSVSQFHRLHSFQGTISIVIKEDVNNSSVFTSITRNCRETTTIFVCSFSFFLQMEPRNRNGQLPPLPGSPTLAEFHRTPTSCRASEHDLSRLRAPRRVPRLVSLCHHVISLSAVSFPRALKHGKTFHAYRCTNIHDFSIYFYLSFFIMEFWKI